MGKRAIWGLGFAVALVIGVSLFLSYRSWLGDPYTRLVSRVGTHWRGMKVSSISERHHPETLVLDFPEFASANAVVTFDRADLPMRVAGAKGIITRRVTYRLEKDRKWWWKALVDRIQGKPHPFNPEFIFGEEPSYPKDFYEVKKRIGKDSPANLVQDMVMIEGVIAKWYQNETAQEFLIVRAELELGAGEKSWVVKDLEKLRRLNPRIAKRFQARAERLRIESGAPGPSFLVP
jgi:hypothetical protein